MKKLFYTLLLAVVSFLPASSLAQNEQPTDSGFVITQPVDKEQFQSGLNDLMRYQEERRAKEKKAAILRIGIGVAFLVVLIIGLSRRRKR